MPRGVLLFCIVLGLMFPAAAAPGSVEGKVEVRKREAARLAAAREWGAALKKVAEAQDLVRVEIRKAAGPVKKQEQAARARSTLLLASLPDLASPYQTQRGDSAQAASSRIRALRTRLQAYQMSGQTTRAMGAADKLLQLSSPDPIPYETVGRFFMEQNRYARAADAWQRGIRLLESGKAKLPLSSAGAQRDARRNRLLTQFYRELAFCHTRLGKAAESQAAIRRALEVEKAVRR